MHFIITDATLARSRAIHLSGTRLALAAVGLSLVLMLLSAAVYHWVIVQGAREHWPVVGSLVRVADSDQLAQRERFMRENLDAMARKLGDMQARMLQLEALGERVGGLAGINPAELKVDPNPGRGGALVDGRPLSLDELQGLVDALDQATDARADLFTAMESRLLEQRFKKMMVPTQNPANGAPVGSPFGHRIDPFTGRSATHTGLDFRATYGSPIVAAAGGVVVTAMLHPDYGNMVEVDHGNGLVTRYGHASRLLVKKGDLVKRGQRLALVGSTGRSTGAHLHFEVLVHGVQQDPQKFLAGGPAADRLMAELTAPNAQAR